MDPIAPTEVTHLLDQRARVVEAELSAALGDASLCAVSKTAGQVPAAKHLEGRLAALSQLRRTVPPAPEDVHAAIRSLRAEWQQALEHVVARDFGPDWRAYRAGGVDELTELAENLRLD